MSNSLTYLLTYHLTLTDMKRYELVIVRCNDAITKNKVSFLKMIFFIRVEAGFHTG